MRSFSRSASGPRVSVGGCQMEVWPGYAQAKTRVRSNPGSRCPTISIEKGLVRFKPFLPPTVLAILSTGPTQICPLADTTGTFEELSTMTDYIICEERRYEPQAAVFPRQAVRISPVSRYASFSPNKELLI